MTPRHPLTATYRLQLNAGFTFAQARAQVEYFAALGISHLYLSPILMARAGSMHGYDVVDPTRINPELGTEDDLRALSLDLAARGMGIIVDIVPNHMGIGPENPYWDDMLAHGERSRYARWFDIDWTPREDGHRKVVLPVLNDDLECVLTRGDLSVRVRGGEPPRVTYFQQSFPLDPAAMPPELQLASLDPEETGELTSLFSGRAGEDRLRALLEKQHYRFVCWRRGPDEINYRRFFDVNDLAALRIDDEHVFAETHALILRLVRDGTIDGLRVDHIDGLLDPLAYLERLRAAAGPETPIFVEKILAYDEHLRPSWPVQGTTGYEFLNDLEDLFIEPTGFREIEAYYRNLRRLGAESFRDIARAGKRRVLEVALRGDVERVARMLAQSASVAGEGQCTLADRSAAMVELIAALPVYRTYIDGHVTTAEDVAAIARAMTATSGGEILSFIGAALRTNSAFAGRFQQLSSPAAAKGVEDTALYQYVPLASRNEVGGAPDRPLDDAVRRFHDGNGERANQWPLSLTATNTHDTKRSADIRARLDVLSEFPQQWERSVRRWRRLNRKHRRTVRGRLAPDTNTEYLIYETLVALWPPPRVGRRTDDLPDLAWCESTRDRLTRYAIKAAREAKTSTNWIDPALSYEAALQAFVAAILEPNDDAPFLADVARLVSRVAMAGAWGSLSRVVLHLTSPGTPDIYQGDELWNFALVDPDNRRPVDYPMRATALHALDPGVSAHSGVLDPFDYRVKLNVVHRLLALRRSRVPLFVRGSYTPLATRGARARHVVAFARAVGGRHLITVAGRLLAGLVGSTVEDWWDDTTVELPAELECSQLRSHLIAQDVIPSNGELELASLLRTIPVAVLAD